MNHDLYFNNFNLYHSPAGILPYNIYLRPDHFPIVDDKDPSLHELLYYDSQKKKDGKSVFWGLF